MRRAAPIKYTLYQSQVYDFIARIRGLFQAFGSRCHRSFARAKVLANSGACYRTTRVGSTISPFWQRSLTSASHRTNNR